MILETYGEYLARMKSAPQMGAAKSAPPAEADEADAAPVKKAAKKATARKAKTEG